MNLMNVQELLARIQKKEITVIEEEVRVEFDNAQQSPLGFQWRGRHYEVLKLLLVLKSPQGFLEYLVLTPAGVFSLSLKREDAQSAFSRSWWILGYRVNDGEPLKSGGGAAAAAGESAPAQGGCLLPSGMSTIALVPASLAIAAYYHGHLCPELAIGYRAALVAEEELGLTREKAADFFVIAENMSSAIEALQIITGCTIGNQNFFAYDLGKHVYYFGRFSTAGEPGKGLRVALIDLSVDLSHKGLLEKKILAGQASALEIGEYQQAVDDAVGEILNLPAEQLFTKTRISLYPPQTTLRRDYIRCCRCGEVTALEKCIPEKDGFVCPVCQAKAC